MPAAQRSLDAGHLHCQDIQELPGIEQAQTSLHEVTHAEALHIKRGTWCLSSCNCCSLQSMIREAKLLNYWISKLPHSEPKHPQNRRSPALYQGVASCGTSIERQQLA